MFFLIRRFGPRGRRAQIIVVAAVVTVAVVVDLLFSSHPAYSIGLIVAVLVIGTTVRLFRVRRARGEHPTEPSVRT
jgi:peptidoglycan/LPS O-acetylase OafA/YrhL